MTKIQDILKEFENKDIYACRACGISLTNRKTWCDLGCGSDYNEMFKVPNARNFLRQALREMVESVEKDNEMTIDTKRSGDYGRGWDDHAKRLAAYLHSLKEELKK
jgi:hypothetical protein